jgi:peptidoglycan hydrolase-like protein with peptidoglycan-binding domain
MMQEREASAGERAAASGPQTAGARRLLPRWRPRTFALAALGGAAAVTALVSVGIFASTEGSDAAAEVTATATVARRDLVQRYTVAGTLGYGDARNVANSRQGTFTSLPGEGRIVRRGDALYRVNAEPVVLFYGSQPAWRPLADGVSDGRDVLQLERNLRALGYADDLTVDEEFTSATASAVERWQKDLGLEETGRVKLGSVVFLPGPRRVGTIAVSLGDRAQPGVPVMTTSSTTRLVMAEIDASDQADVAVGDKVVIDLLNGRTTTGTISEVGKVASVAGGETNADQTSGGSTTSTIAFEIRPDKPSAVGRLDQAPVEVGVTNERAKNALSVPVSALLALRGGGYGLEVVRGETTTIVTVTPGLYSDGGFVEITGGNVKAGDGVVVPA